MKWWGVLLIAFGGFLAGGVASTWRNARVASIILAVLSLAAIAGGVLWMI